MPKNTNAAQKDEKSTKKAQKTISTKSTNKTTKTVSESKVKKENLSSSSKNKSIQNAVIDNIKHFISKILEMQEKVKQDEAESKQNKQNQTKKTEEVKSNHLLEYYDLPYRYNETVVKILAQTPKRLFVYWDVSDVDKQTYINAFGESFFENTYPVLLVHNEDKNQTYEVVINDFANSWYLDISNPRDHYTLQLGRKFKNSMAPSIKPEAKIENIHLNHDYLMIAKSNPLEVPNDHILLEEFKPYVTYRNVKTKQEETKTVQTTLYKNELKTWYQKLYPNEILLNENGKFDLQNPSSHLGTSSSIAK